MIGLLVPKSYKILRQIEKFFNNQIKSIGIYGWNFEMKITHFQISLDLFSLKIPNKLQMITFLIFIHIIFKICRQLYY